MTNSSILPPPPDWLAPRVAAALDCAPSDISLTTVTGDAGSRCYYRACGAARGTQIVVVDADATQQATFLRVRGLFAAAGVRVPTVRHVAADFLLLEDFGDTTYQCQLPAQAQELYSAAIETLVIIQRDTTLAAALPPYDAARLHAEMQLFEDWYCRVHLVRPLSATAQHTLHQAQAYLADAMTAAPPVAVHRDYHCRNLMWLGSAPPGVLDFQDAVCGEVLYDVVSLLRDAYVEWPAAQQAQWLEQYWHSARAAGVPAGETLQHCQERFNIAGAQRGLKVLGIFARLHHRDGKPGYLNDLPRVHRHLLAACAAVPQLAALRQLITDYPPQ